MTVEMPPESPSEIEVTPEMKAAGARVLSEIYPEECLDWLTEDRAFRVYSAMASVAPKRASQGRPPLESAQ